MPYFISSLVDRRTEFRQVVLMQPWYTRIPVVTRGQIPCGIVERDCQASQVHVKSLTIFVRVRRGLQHCQAAVLACVLRDNVLPGDLRETCQPNAI